MIFEECSAPPVWHKENITPNDALADYLAGGRCLDERGAANRIGDAHPMDPAVLSAAPRRSPEEIAERREREDREAAIADIEWRAEIQRIRTVVQSACAGDDMDLHDVDGNVVCRVPRVPFLNYALWRTPAAHLAHLANIGRERNIPILRVEGAVAKFPVGATVLVDPTRGIVRLVTPDTD